jgi:outer membrane protein
LPKAREEALTLGRREHPAVVGAMHDVDTAQAAIRIAEAALYPTLNAQGAVSRSVQTDTSLTTSSTNQASIVGNATLPLYDGGLAASQVRQAKEALAQARLVLDQVRVQIEAAIVIAWVTNEGAKIAIRAGEAEVRAATIALAGIRKEFEGGQRRILDVLNAQQDLMGARSRLIGAQRDRVVASYTLAAALGRLDHRKLELNTSDYEPQTHYHQVRDAWHGLRTPSGQ